MADALCQFALVAPGDSRCLRCGNRLRSDRPERCVARCGGHAANSKLRKSTEFDLATARDPVANPCIHLGAPTGRSASCRGCPGSRRVHELFACARFEACLPLASLRGVPSCATCVEYSPTAPVLAG